MRETYLAGQWNAICDVCGLQFKSHELRLRWDEMMVCSRDYEMRNMQDFVPAPKELSPVPWTSKETDTFI